jgi:hypothetical protein
MIKLKGSSFHVIFLLNLEINANKGIKSCSFIMEITLKLVETNFAFFSKFEPK